MGSQLQWNKVLNSFLGDEDLARELAAAIGKDSDAVHCIQFFCSRANLSDSVIRRITLLLDISELVDGNLSLLFFILAQPEVKSLSTIARRFYTINSATTRSNISATDVDTFRSKLFRKEPTGVIWGLLQRGTIRHNNDDIQKQAISFFERAVAVNFNIGLTSLPLRVAEDEAARFLPDEERKPLLQFLETLQRLHVLVSDANDIQLLIHAGFFSAHDIASTSDYLDTAVSKGLSRSAAIGVFRRAIAIEQRNEQRWVDYIKSRTNIPVLALEGGDVSADSASDRVNLSTLFNEMNQVQVDQYTSVLSPAAYLVDLLEFLRYSLIDQESSDGKPLTTINTTPTSTTLLDEIIRRRPDIKHLELSKPNTVNSLRYSDLAIEIMESYIASTLPANKQDKAQKPTAFNERTSNADNTPQSPFINTNWDIYESPLAMSQQIFPMKHFPFNLAFHTITELAESSGTYRPTISDLFQDRSACRQSLALTDSSLAFALVDEACNRRSAADHLGLDQNDFVAVTKEGFMSFEFMRAKKDQKTVLLRSSYDSMIGLRSVGEYWGFSNDDDVVAENGGRKPAKDTETPSHSDDGEPRANLKMLGEIPGTKGLNNMSELLLKAGISFQDLLAILETEFMAKTLVISVQNDAGYYTEDYNKMRLQVSPQAEEDMKISFEDCLGRLHSFLRLWHRLDWSIWDTDAAIVTVEASRLSGSPSSFLPSIQPETIEDLAAIKQVNTITSIPVRELLPLWGDFRVEGPECYYQKVFMRPSLLAKYPGFHTNAFKAASSDDNEEEEEDSDGDSGEESDEDERIESIVKPHQTVAYYVTPLMGILGLRLSDAPALFQASQVKATERWTLKAVSALYRANLFSKVLGVPLSRYSLWLEADPATGLALSGPRATCAILQRWQDLHKNGSSSEWLIDILRPKCEDNNLPLTDAIKATAGLISAFSQAEQKYQAYSCSSKDGSNDVEMFTKDRLLEMMTLLFSAQFAQQLSALTEGSAAFTSPFLAITKKSIPDNLKGKILSGSNGIASRCLLTAGDRDALTALDSGNLHWAKAVASLFSQSESLRVQLASLCEDKSAPPSFLFETTSDSALTDADFELEICARRKQLILLATPKLMDREMALTTNDFVRTHFPALGLGLAASLVSSLDLSRFPISTQGKEWIKKISYGVNLPEVLHGMNKAVVQSSKEHFTGFYLATETADHVLTAAKELTLDGTKLEANKPTTFSLVQGQSYVLKFQGAPGTDAVTISTPATTLQTEFSSSLISPATVKAFTHVFDALRRGSSIIQKFDLSANETGTLIKTGVNVSQPDWQDIDAINCYCELKSFLNSKRLPTFLLGVQELSGDGVRPLEPDRMLLIISSITGWSLAPVKHLIISKLKLQRWTKPTELKTLFRFLLVTKQIVSVYESLGLPRDVLDSWVGIHLPHDTASEYVAAKTMISHMMLRNDARVMTACENLIMKKKDALINFLLSHKDMKDRKIFDANGLFEYFLVDVQMGPEQQTSRIQQAVSTIQLYVQRCLLGLEVKNRLRPNSIDRKKWQWMQKFTLWQANRRVFLFPENWIEPSLRDDKSEAFKAIEAAVLQSNLSKDKIAEIIQQYVYNTHEVADLDIQSYFWEKSDQFRGTYHFFARTRTAPYGYFYRPLKVTGVNVNTPVYDWLPWSKLEIDIPTYEVDWDGNTLASAGSYLVPSTYKGRLFLFMPQIMLKTQPRNKNGGDKTMWQLAKEAKVSDMGTQSYWEVKMGWSECRNGSWSTKLVSSSALDVDGINTPSFMQRAANTTNTDAIIASINATSTDIKTLPGISSLRFWVRARETKDYDAKGNIVTDEDIDDEILVIQVYRWVRSNDTKDDSKQYRLQTLGRFEMRGSQMVAIRDVQTEESALKLTSPTYFNKLHMSTTDSTWAELEMKLEDFKEANATAQADSISDTKLLLALAPPIKQDNQKLVWTLSYNESQCAGASGLVVERMTGSRVQTYFGATKRGIDGSIVDTSRRAKDTQRLAYDASQGLMEVAATTTDMEEIFSVLTKVSPRYMSLAFGGRDFGTYSELASPYSLYNWELGFHAIWLLVERLLSTQQFELGLEVAHMVFDPWSQGRKVISAQGKGATKKIIETKSAAEVGAPTSSPELTVGTSDINLTANTTSSALAECWRFPPFKSSKVRLAGSMGRVVKLLKAGRGKDDLVDEWLSNPFNAHSLARGRPALYMRRFVMKYIELLIASGDELFRQESMESIPLALQRYVQASHLFGPTPQALPSPVKATVRTYAQLFNSVNDFSSAAVDLELTFPFFANTLLSTQSAAVVNEAPRYSAVLGMVQSSCFTVPANPELALLRERIDDRLYKIRNSLDINGNKRRLPLFDPPIDPSQLVKAAASGISASSFAGGIDGPMPNYRFLFLLQKAFEMCGELKTQSEAYLSIKEKKDAEKLSVLRTSQEASTQLLTMSIKEMQREDAQKSIEILTETRESHVMRLKYYLALIGESESKVPDGKTQWQDLQQAIGTPTKDELAMSPEEALEWQKTEEATALKNIASALDRSSSILMALPNLSTNVQPMGMGASMKFDASNIAHGMQLISSAIQTESSSRSDDASRASRKGQLIRQLQERRLSANVTARDIKNVDRQLEAQKIKLDICSREIELHKKQIADTAETLEYMKTKYTNESLYSWMDASMHSLLYQTYTLAMDLAQSAEKAFLFERGPTAANERFLSNSTWDSGRNGAFAAQNLYLGLKRIESAFHKRKSHDFELTKDISLRQLDPWALLQLQATGDVKFSLPETLFDMDFPGHYCRRIKSISLTIPCVHGPYTSIASTLRLLSHCYRLRRSAGSGTPYYPDAAELDTDLRYRTDHIPISSVAASTANQDTGTFEASFSGDRYGPFEGAGVISSWALGLPKLRQFDYRTISDVILQVKYTSLDGGAGWADDAFKAVDNFQGSLGGNMYVTPFELGSGMMSRFLAESNETTIELRNISNQLPFWTRSKAAFKQAWVVAPKKSKLSTTTTLNEQPVQESSRKVGDMRVFETSPGNYEWVNLKVVLSGITPKDIQDQSIWILVGYTVG
ncbi:hypothetical protein AB5N19_00158 [Seiridium cardinale]